jgi:hypothetical protein
MRLTAAIVSLSIAGSAAAHHSNAEYDRSSLRELEGQLTDVRWRNPHVMLKLRTENAAGTTEDWELAGLPISLLEGAGLMGSLFSEAIGQRVKVAGWPSRTRASMLVNNVLLPSGDEALFYPQSKLRWSTRQAGGDWARESVSGGQRGLFRVWSVADLGAYLRMAQAIAVRLTPAAQAKMATPPRLDVCRPQGMPGIMLNPLPMRFVDRGDHIELELTSFGVVRNIHLTQRPDRAAVPLSDLGYSVGRREAEDTLEVRTTRVGWPYVDDDGRPQSTNVEILERFRLADDGSRMTYVQTVTDPISLAEPLTVSWDLIDAGDTIEPLSCE